MANFSSRPTRRNSLATFRLALWGLVAVVAIVAGGFYLWRPPAGPPGITGAPFTLDSTAGGEFTQASFKGSPTILFFGYTSCPDVCPTTLAEMTAIRNDLKLKPSDMKIVFATVDPVRDTLAQLSGYLSGFGTPIIGLTGSVAQVAEAKKAFGIYSKNDPPDASGAYIVEHTATVFLLDGNGSFAGTIDYGEDQKVAEAKIKRLAGA